MNLFSIIQNSITACYFSKSAVIAAVSFLFTANCYAVAEIDNSSWQQHREWFEQQQILKKNESPNYVNKLINEDSPYLLSHSLQPVNWHPWNETSWDLAKSENKLVYLSIGYQTCHWCHVIAKESYQNLDVAELLNNEFISIKVDREVQVEVDNRYRRALENMSGEAGWPIQVILTPDEKILWIDSYLPKEDVVKILDRLSQRWNTNEELINNIAEGLNQRLLPPLLLLKTDSLTAGQISDAYEQSLIQAQQILEVELSGNGPRFVRPDWLLMMLEDYQLNPSNKLITLQLVEQQVEQLLTSPTYDIVEGGIHRYAVDGYWQVPHYEKMLYDQAMLIRVLAKLYTLTGNQAYLNIALQTVTWVDKNLALSSDSYHGYASSMSAISTTTGIEGDYYRLPSERLNRDAFSSWTWVNNEGGALIHTRLLGTLSPQDQRKFYALRDPQKRPDIDQKWVLSWNALYLLALNELYAATNDSSLSEKIKELTESTLNAYNSGAELQRIRFGNSLSMPATLEDYSLAILASLASSQTMLSFEYQQKAENLGGNLISILEKAEWSNLVHDGELPASSALAYESLQQLLRISKTDRYLNAINLIEAKLLSLLTLNSPQHMAITNRIGIAQGAISTDKVTAKSSASFASGNGIARIERRNNQLWLDLKLAPNWHINAPSNSVTENTLKITTVHSDYYQGLNAEFPESITKTVSFFDTPLNLYEGLTHIQLEENSEFIHGATIKVNTQACSDRLCLLPEEFQLLVPAGS